MGSSESTLKKLEELSYSLNTYDSLDSKELKSLFDKYDKNKNGLLEDEEVERFINDVYQFVYGRTTPKKEVTVKYGALSSEEVKKTGIHQPGCKGRDYTPQHLTPGVCTVLVDVKQDPEAERQYKEDLFKVSVIYRSKLMKFKALDPNGDRKLTWDEFFKCLEKVLKDTKEKMGGRFQKIKEADA